MDKQQIASELRSFLEGEFPNPGVILEDSTDLLNGYFIDSLGLVNTALFLESQFEIDLSRADINESNFHSLQTLVDFVASRLEVAVQ